MALPDFSNSKNLSFNFKGNLIGLLDNKVIFKLEFKNFSTGHSTILLLLNEIIFNEMKKK